MPVHNTVDKKNGRRRLQSYGNAKEEHLNPTEVM